MNHIGRWMSALDENLSEIAETLMARFSSKEGYKASDNAIPTSQCQQYLTFLFR